MGISLKYAVVERERRYLVASIPAGVAETRDIVDRYIEGTRLRLREVTSSDGSVVRKLNQKIRLTDGPSEVACTSVYLDEAEWAALSGLPGAALRKRRHLVLRDGLKVAVDEFPNGTLLAEIDDGETPSAVVPAWLEVVEDVSDDERWTGVRRAR
jgi:CYTH domain-containing protein